MKHDTRRPPAPSKTGLSGAEGFGCVFVFFGAFPAEPTGGVRRALPWELIFRPGGKNGLIPHLLSTF